MRVVGAISDIVDKTYLVAGAAGGWLSDGGGLMGGGWGDGGIAVIVNSDEQIQQTAEITLTTGAINCLQWDGFSHRNDT